MRICGNFPHAEASQNAAARKTKSADEKRSQNDIPKSPSRGIRLLYDRFTTLGQHRRVADRPEIRLTLGQADQARTDFAAIESDLEPIYARRAPLPARADLPRATLLIAFVAVVLGIDGIEAFWRHFPACGSI